MSTFLPKEVQEGLDKARVNEKRRKARHRVKFDGNMYPVVDLWDNGFSVESEDAPQMRGLVDIFEGPTHLSRCLIIASDEKNGEVSFEFKRSTLVEDQAPLDFALRSDAPIALLT